jgi:hypothetical protein
MDEKWRRSRENQRKNGDASGVGNRGEDGWTKPNRKRGRSFFW